jgi:hypothetical protein
LLGSGADYLEVGFGGKMRYELQRFDNKQMETLYESFSRSDPLHADSKGRHVGGFKARHANRRQGIAGVYL